MIQISHQGMSHRTNPGRGLLTYTFLGESLSRLDGRLSLRADIQPVSSGLMVGLADLS
jgi:hypothetical protein